MSTLIVENAAVFEPLLHPRRYKGAWGGRGSGKSHFFAQQIIARCVRFRGHRVMCGRQVQKSLKESAMQLVKDKIDALKAPGFRPMVDRIETPGGGVIVFQGLAEHTADSLKSYEGFNVFWIEEAHTISEHSLKIIRPTLRAPDSELWFSWNPRRKADPVDALLRGPHAEQLGSVVVEANWRDNPWFPQVLRDERAYDEEHEPDTYEHIWEGKYAGVHRGAYYAQSLAKARREGRIGHLAPDPLVQLRAFWDLGIADYTAIWIAQFVGKEIRVLDYIEGQGQPLSFYVSELRDRNYDKALCVLPHDGARRDAIMAVKYEDHLKDAGFKVQTVENQGAGAAMIRVQAARRLFPQMWFDETKTESGRETLGAYHERRDEERQVGLGPEHDWASHGADAFGLMAVAYEPAKPAREPHVQRTQWEADTQSTAWMRT